MNLALLLKDSKLQRSWEVVRSGAENALRRTRCTPQQFILGVIFLAAFTVPVLIVREMRTPLLPSTEYLHNLEASSQRLEPSGGRFVFQGTEQLNPPEDKDFLVFATWKLQSLPAPGERTVLISKTRARNRSAVEGGTGDGFALGIINDQGSLRFMLAWPGPEGSRWMRFGDVDLRPNDWFLVALSVRKKKSVGAFFVPLTGMTSKPKVAVLGGFAISGVAGDSLEPLSVAPQGSGRFMGRLGPVGVLRGGDLGGHEQDILREIARAPTTMPDFLNRNQILLFWGGGAPTAVGINDRTTFTIARVGS